MNYDEYRIEAPKTCARDHEAWGLAHWVDGFVNEASELHNLTKKRHYGLTEDELLKTRRADLLEEFGDMSWYLSCFFTWYDEEHADVDASDHIWAPPKPLIGQVEFDLYQIFNKMVIKAAKALDHLDYAEFELETRGINTNPGPLVYGPAVELLHWLNVARAKLGFTWEEIFESNIAKLRRRYKEAQWTKEQALERDTEAEMQAIEDVSR